MAADSHNAKKAEILDKALLAYPKIEGVSNTKIGQELGFSKNFVKKRREALGLPAWDHKESPLWRKLKKYPLLDKEAVTKIAKRFNCSHHTVTQVKESLGLGPYMAMNKLDKLCEEENIKEILVKHNAETVGKMFNCSKTLVNKARHRLGVSYKHRAKPKYARYTPSSAFWKEVEKKIEHNNELMVRWGCLKERVGLTRNEWKKKCLEYR